MPEEPRTNCLSTKWYMASGRCEQVFTCTYQEKKTCRAVREEIAYMTKRLETYVKKMEKKLKQLDDSIK